ncbi:hypothetical protein [Aurantiacibacter hainanensis]|uniref:hypothetical protein n=1 Tax=Aurantiacibacter hainanensis TaxID=3076114 RepID=UPI0030C72287
MWQFAIITVTVPLSILIGAYLARWVASLFVTDYSASIAGFSFVLGVNITGAQRFADLSLGLTAWIMLAQIMGLACVFFIFFRRELLGAETVRRSR